MCQCQPVRHWAVQMGCALCLTERCKVEENDLCAFTVAQFQRATAFYFNGIAITQRLATDLHFAAGHVHVDCALVCQL